jgi:hypothetical protein
MSRPAPAVGSSTAATALYRSAAMRASPDSATPVRRLSRRVSVLAFWLLVSPPSPPGGAVLQSPRAAGDPTPAAQGPRMALWAGLEGKRRRVNPVRGLAFGCHASPRRLPPPDRARGRWVAASSREQSRGARAVNLNTGRAILSPVLWAHFCDLNVQHGSSGTFTKPDEMQH